MFPYYTDDVVSSNIGESTYLHSGIYSNRNMNILCRRLLGEYLQRNARHMHQKLNMMKQRNDICVHI